MEPIMHTLLMGLQIGIFWKTVWQDLPEFEHKHIHSHSNIAPGYILNRNLCTGTTKGMNMKALIIHHRSKLEKEQMFINSRMDKAE